VNVHGFTQFRYNWNSRDDSGLDPNGNDQTIGFQNARTKLTFSGNVGNEKWGYRVMFKFEDPGSNSGIGILDDAFGTYNMGNGWTFKFGQFKMPLYREELVGDEYQLFANRSVVNSFFTQKRSQGLQFSYDGDQWRFAAAFSDGINTANSDFTSAAEADYAFTARGEWKWAGDWKQARDFTSFRNSSYFGMLGVAGNYQSGGDTVGTVDQKLWALTADVSVEGNGWNLFGAAYFSDLDPAVGSSFQDWAFQIQGGFFVSEDWEIIAGYSILVPDSDRNPADHNFNTLQVGVNHYFIPESHALKLTIDLSYFIDTQSETGIAIPSTATGLLASSSDSQWNLRGQIQLMF